MLTVSVFVAVLAFEGLTYAAWRAFNASLYRNAARQIARDRSALNAKAATRHFIHAKG